MKRERKEETGIRPYAAGRLDYFAGKALQGLVTGRAERDLKNVVGQAIAIAKEMVEQLDP